MWGLESCMFTILIEVVDWLFRRFYVCRASKSKCIGSCENGNSMLYNLECWLVMTGIGDFNCL